MIFEKFVQQVAGTEYMEWKETIYAHQSVSQFLKTPATMLRYTGTDQSPFDVFSEFENSFMIIQTTLGNATSALSGNAQSMDEKGIDQSNTDYLFLSACFVIEHLFNPYTELPLRPFKQPQCDLMADFIKAVDGYEQANYPSEGIQDNWEAFWSDTGLPKEPRFESRPNPTRRSYIRWKHIPAWIKIDTTARSA